jgi:hypothetical protein
MKAIDERTRKKAKMLRTYCCESAMNLGLRELGKFFS